MRWKALSLLYNKETRRSDDRDILDVILELSYWFCGLFGNVLIFKGFLVFWWLFCWELNCLTIWKDIFYNSFWICTEQYTEGIFWIVWYFDTIFGILKSTCEWNRWGVLGVWWSVLKCKYTPNAIKKYCRIKLFL